MSEDIKTSYVHLLKIASALEQLENIQHEVGKKHPGAQDNPSAKYDDVQNRFEQPYDHMQKIMGQSQKVVGADEFEELHSAEASKGLNQRFFYPHSKEFKKSGSFIRKSTGRKIKNQGL